MNKIIVLSICFVLVTSVCFAKSYVVINSDSSVFTVSSKNDTQLSEGQTLKVVDQDFSLFCDSLPNHPSLCKLSGNTFVEDSALIEQANVRISEMQIEDEIQKEIKSKERENAIASLKQKGKLPQNFKDKHA